MSLCVMRGGRGTIIAVLGLLMWASTSAPLFAEGATRSLAGYTDPAVTFTVTITIDPPAGAAVVGLEDSPPPGWTQISNITNGGVYDAGTHKVKWGPIFVPFPQQVAYDLLPPAEVSSADCFVGAVSFDGLDQAIQGDLCFPGPIPAVTEWGMVVMALLVVTAGTVVLTRCRRLPARV